MKKGWLSILLAFALLIPLSGQTAAEGQYWRFVDFRVIQHDDNSLTVDGIMEKPKAGEGITIKLSTGEYENVNGRREYAETVLSETKGILNAKGYFRVKTPPVDAAKLRDNKLTITAMDQDGQKTGYSEAFPVSLKANEPGLFSRTDNYAKYMDSSQLALSFEEGQKLGSNAVKLAKRLVAGDQASYFLDNDGKLWGWGEVPSIFDKAVYLSYATWRQPKPITAITNVAQVSVGGKSGALLTKQGEIWQWDYRSAGIALVRIGKFSGIKEIAVDYDGNGLILKQDGTVHSWTLSYGKTDENGHYKAPKVTVKAISTLTGITSIAISPNSLYGYATHLALQKNGAVWAWGDLSVIASARQKANTNENKQLEDGLGRYMFTSVVAQKPEQLKGFPPITQIAMIGSYPLLVSDEAEMWSYVSTKDSFIKKPGKVSHGVAAVFNNSSYVLGTDGAYYEWNEGNPVLFREPVAMLTGLRSIAQSVSAYSDSQHTLGVNAEGNLVAWGHNFSGQLGISATNPAPSAPYLISKVNNAVSVAGGKEHMLALGGDGTLYGWGSNASGQINGSNRDDILSPIVITKDQGIKKLAAGDGFSFYVDQKGKLYGWGDLKRFGLEDAKKPTAITLISEAIKDIAVYDYSAIALGASGKVYQLGGTAYMDDEILAYRGSFVRTVEQISDATAIGIGRAQGYAIRKDGTVWHWSNTIKDEAIQPKAIAGLKNIKLLSAATANNDYVIALDKNGDLWAWGDNTASQLGRQIKQSLTSPVKVTNEPYRLTETSLTSVGKKLNYRTISASRKGALLLTTNNEMLFFGYSSNSLLDKKLNHNVSFALPQENNFYFIIDGKLYVSGRDNAKGLLGNGTKSYFDTPQAVRTPTGAKLNAATESNG
ncbi:RCC1 domain-containing protein [Paenibacillus sp. CAU 1782]